jgi:WD40 repeat protein
VAFSPDGQRVLTGSNDGKVIVWDAASGESLLTLGRRGDRWIHAAAFSPDGLNIAIGSYEGKITL